MTRFFEFVLSRLVGATKHRGESLTQKERRAQEILVQNLDIRRRKTKEPIIVAFIGSVGSGKSSVAQELAYHIGGTVIEVDQIRVQLRKQSERYEGAQKIAENMVREVVTLRGSNAVLDSDFSKRMKRASLREKARRAGVRLVFVRTVCDRDEMIGRMIIAHYENRPEDFFGGASSLWKGNQQIRGAVVKIREWWRQTPHHYSWSSQGGGKWRLKILPVSIFAEIDTTDPDLWKQEVQKCAEKLLAM